MLLIGFACAPAPEHPETVNTVDSVSVFDPVKWKVLRDDAYPYRADMLDDLVESRVLKTLSEDEVLDLLGPPTRKDSSYLFYRVDQTRLFMWPLHTTTLVIKLSADSTENQVLIHE